MLRYAVALVKGASGASKGYACGFVVGVLTLSKPHIGDFLPQDAQLSLVEEAAECTRYLHSCYLLEAEPRKFPSASSREQHEDADRCFGQETPSSAQQGDAGDVFKTSIEDLAPKNTTEPSPRKRWLHSLAFPASTLPVACRKLLQEYPCLRSPVVLTRMLQGGDFVEGRTESLLLPTSTGGEAIDVGAAVDRTTTPEIHVESERSRCHRGCRVAAATQEHETFSSHVRLHFRGLSALANQLVETSDVFPAAATSKSWWAHGSWEDVWGQLAATEAGAAAVEAGLAPWEAAELFADIFKTSVLGQNCILAFQN